MFTSDCTIDIVSMALVVSERNLKVETTWERDHWMSAAQQHYKLQWTLFSYVTFKLASTHIHIHTLPPPKHGILLALWSWQIRESDKTEQKKQGSKILLIAHTDYHTPCHQTQWFLLLLWAALPEAQGSNWLPTPGVSLLWIPTRAQLFCCLNLITRWKLLLYTPTV